MKKYDFDTLINRRGTRSTKWDVGGLLIECGMADRFDEDTIPAFTADMDFACPTPIVEGMKKIANQQIYGYTQPGADGAYNSAIIDWHRRKYGWNIDEDQIVYMNGTINAINRAIYSFTKPGDGIVIQKPVYSPFEMIINGSGRSVENNPLVNQNGYYTMNFDDLEEKLKNPENTMMILCNPHNPVGRVWTKEEAQHVCDLCEKYGVLLVSDEIHADLTRCSISYNPIAMIPSNCRKIICTGINKTFNVAGLQCTNVIIPDKSMCEQYQKDTFEQIGPVTPTPFAIEAVIQAYSNCDDWLDELKEYLDENMDFVENFLRTNLPKIGFSKPEGTYIIWMDFSAYGNSEEVLHRLSKNANLVLDSGAKYGADGYIRACIPMPRVQLEEMFRRIYREFC
jgi:cysteine-S-conjugate beta-lyase